jgi:hypothetical protein
LIAAFLLLNFANISLETLANKMPKNNNAFELGKHCTTIII